MKLSNFIDGLNILRQHFNGGDGYHIGAEHDQFYVFATDSPLSDDEAKKMIELGWFQPEVTEGSEYDKTEGWSAYT